MDRTQTEINERLKEQQKEARLQNGEDSIRLAYLNQVIQSKGSAGGYGIPDYDEAAFTAERDALLKKMEANNAASREIDLSLKSNTPTDVKIDTSDYIPATQQVVEQTATEQPATRVKGLDLASTFDTSSMSNADYVAEAKKRGMTLEELYAANEALGKYTSEADKKEFASLWDGKGTTRTDSKPTTITPENVQAVAAKIQPKTGFDSEDSTQENYTDLEEVVDNTSEKRREDAENISLSEENTEENRKAQEQLSKQFKDAGLTKNEALKYVSSAVQMYKNGDLGEVGSKEAKGKLWMFALNQLGTTLMNFGSNLQGRDGTAKSLLSEVMGTNMQKGLERFNQSQEDMRANQLRVITDDMDLEKGARSALEDMINSETWQNVSAFRNETAVIRSKNLAKELGKDFTNMSPDEFMEALYGLSMTGDIDAQRAAIMLLGKATSDPAMKTKLDEIAKAGGDVVGSAANALLDGTFGGITSFLGGN